MTRRWPGPRAVLAAVAIFYAILGLWILEPDALYSGDIGVKFVQARALASARFAGMDIPYPGAFLDPAAEFRPLRPPFILSTAGTTQAIFSPLSAVVQAGAVAAAGMRGLFLISLAGGAAVLAAAAAMARREERTAVILLAGLGSPLWFYAVSGWEHAPAVALGAWGVAAAFRARSWRGACAAGALAGAGAVLRDEVVLLVPGILAILAWRHRSARQPAAALAALALPLTLAAIVEVGWFQRPAAAHLRHAVHLVQRAAHLTSAPNPDVPALAPFTIRDRYEAVVQYWLLGYGDDRWIAAFLTALAAALVIGVRMRSPIPLFAWLLGTASLAALDTHEVLTAPKWLAGLLRVSPWLVFAILPRPRLAGGPVWPRRAILLTAGIYLAVAFAGVDTTGGKSLGPRLLLPLLPLLAVNAVQAIREYVQSAVPWERRTGTLGVALGVMALAIHLGGTIPAYAARNRDDAKGLRAVAATSERLIVADDEFTAQLLLPLYYRRILMLADTPEQSRQLGARLAGQGLRSLVAVTRWSDTPVDFTPFRKRRTERHGRLTIQFWER